MAVLHPWTFLLVGPAQPWNTSRPEQVDGKRQRRDAVVAPIRDGVGMDALVSKTEQAEPTLHPHAMMLTIYVFTVS